MGNIAAISPAGAQPVARTSPSMVSQAIASLPATMVESNAIAVSPVQAPASIASVAPELPQETAARLLVENADGIVLDNIPFTNDAAILLDDLPLPEAPEAEAKPKPEPEPEPEAAAPEADLAHLATRGYLADREAVAPVEPPEDRKPEVKAEQQAPVPAAPDDLLSRSD